MRVLCQVDGLTVAYGNHAPVLRDVCLQIHAGETVGLMGASGSGKSTLAAVLHGWLPPASRVLAGAVSRPARTAMIRQEPNLTLSPFLRVGTQIRDRCPHSNPHKLLSELGFEDPDRIARRYPHQLSGGQRQRILWAQALAQRPDLLIGDEPTTAQHDELARRLAAIARERVSATLWISHDRALLEEVAGRIVTLRDGVLAC